MNKKGPREVTLKRVWHAIVPTVNKAKGPKARLE
jgi:hypothetical protein